MAEDLDNLQNILNRIEAVVSDAEKIRLIGEYELRWARLRGDLRLVQSDMRSLLHELGREADE